MIFHRVCLNIYRVPQDPVIDHHFPIVGAQRPAGVYNSPQAPRLQEPRQ
jgi:hypothetical protein